MQDHVQDGKSSQVVGLFRTWRRRGVLIAAVMTAGGSALLVPTVFQPASAATVEQFNANVLPDQGVQIYECRQEGATTKLAFLKPVAELDRGIHHDQGPVWTAPDGSSVKGAVVQSTPREGTIPELTLSATSVGGPGILSEVTQIRRINTQGGVAPQGPCTLGDTVQVPYTATYVFS